MGDEEGEPELPFWRSLFNRKKADHRGIISEERLLRLELTELRSRLRKGPGADKWSAAPKRARDHFARSKARETLKYHRKKVHSDGPRNLELELMVARFRPSPILDALIPDRRQRWKDIMRRPVRRRHPAIALRNFSLLDDPDATLLALRNIGLLEAEELRAFIHFDDHYCLDAGAYLVLAEIWPTMAKVFSGGRMQKAVQKVLNATRVGQHNQMALRGIDNDDLDENGAVTDVWAFPLQRRRLAGSSTSNTVHLDPQTREQAADRFCAAVDEWLGVPEIEQELTAAGRGWLAQIIGELLCNAERHSRPGSEDGDWSTTAFMVRRSEDGATTLRCYMAFLTRLIHRAQSAGLAGVV